MSDGERYTAYCGLYCRDCIPANHPLFAVAQELDDALGACRFERYAEVRAERGEAELRDFPRFRTLLRALRSLECLAPCAAGGGCRAECAVRDCVRTRGLRGCWACEERGVCPRLAPLKLVHPHLAEHHELIRAHGLDGWAVRRKAHYAWEDEARLPGQS
jgi:hypothetical protein